MNSLFKSPRPIPWSFLATALCVAMGAAQTGMGTDNEVIKLFSGKDLSQWTSQKKGGWSVGDGLLGPGEKPGGYLWTRRQFGDFELELDFKMSKHCNSGVFFRTDSKNAVQGGFEIQIFDSHGREKAGKHDCGALYDALAPSVNAAKPAGEWNHMKVVCRGPLVRVELNGKQVVDANIDQWTTARKNPDGTRNKFRIALKDLPRTGHIGLQYHGYPVWFKAITVRTL